MNVKRLVGTVAATSALVAGVGVSSASVAQARPIDDATTRVFTTGCFAKDDKGRTFDHVVYKIKAKHVYVPLWKSYYWQVIKHPKYGYGQTFFMTKDKKTRVRARYPVKVSGSRFTLIAWKDRMVIPPDTVNFNFQSPLIPFGKGEIKMPALSKRTVCTASISLYS